MPMILNETTIAAGAVNANIIAGSAFEFAQVQEIVSIGLHASVAGAFCTITAGSSIVAEEFPLPIVEPGNVANYPAVPHEMYFTDVMNPGDRLVIRVRNPSAAAVTVQAVVQISATGR